MAKQDNKLQHWVSPAATIVTLAIGAMAFFYNYDTMIRDNAKRSTRNTESITRIHDQILPQITRSAEKTRLDVREMRTIQALQGKRLEKIDNKLDHIQELLVKGR